MSLKNIGNVISELRKNKGVKQEDLATAVGVSTQAVSKWENGGTPDTELLPLIADYFSVSIDMLFGRSLIEYSDINIEIVKYISSFKEDEQFMEAYKLCWAIQQGLWKGTVVDKNKEAWGEFKYTDFEIHDHLRHSGILHSTGTTLMALYKELQYYFITPMPRSELFKSLLETTEYQKLFQMLSDIDILNALILLHSRSNTKSFTPNLLVKELSISIEKAEFILEELDKCGYIWNEEIELDDEIKRVSKFVKREAFVPMLIFAQQLIKRPKTWTLFSCSDGDAHYSM